MNPFSSFVFHQFVFVIAAWVAYAFDRRFGQSSYRRWYNLTHEQRLPEDTVLGFVCGRTGKTKCTMAIILALVVTAGLATFSHGNVLTWFFTGLFGILSTILGFITGPLVLKLWGGRVKVFTAIDKLEAGEIDPVKSVKQTGQKLRQRFGRVFGWWDEFWQSTSFATTPPPSAKATPPAENPTSLDSFPRSESEGDDLLDLIGSEPSEPENGDKSEPTGSERIRKFTGGRS